MALLPELLHYAIPHFTFFLLYEQYKKSEEKENNSSKDLHRDFGHHLFPQAHFLSGSMK